MNEEDKALMAQYDITSESKIVYSYKQHRYEKLSDAVNFAKLEVENTNPNSTDNTPA